MSELRQDPLTRDWVVIAPERAARPRSVDASSLTTCPFCPGNESQTPSELWRLSDDAGRWRIRVVRNRFAVLEGDSSAERRTSVAGFVSMPGVGHHEVVIESPNHTADLALMSWVDVRQVLSAFRIRYRALAASHTDGVVLIFRNHGIGAGTSLAHPHSQIVATPVVPVQVRHRFDVAVQHYDDFGTCVYADTLERELRDARRVVLESGQFVVFHPFASAGPYETYVVPRRQNATFGGCTDCELDDLATVLQRVLTGLGVLLRDPAYNLMLQSAPLGDEQRPYFRWHVRIMPRLATPAGFELGTGMTVNPTSPEATASALRAAMADNHV